MVLGSGIFPGVPENFRETGEIFGGASKTFCNPDRFGSPAVFSGVGGQSDRLFRGSFRESRTSRLQCSRRQITALNNTVQSEARSSI